ncbi:helix-turn-helix domain-containing protein [Streptomyces liliiviolaceus]|uniref:helix-turn-helix domain-containing protein n=1 Tax=Streptomyces liliiviolaceus TaxID=2823109 RepID=UPI001FFC5FC7|nr:transposase family protein [Streptomyces liliiviolaceus]
MMGAGARELIVAEYRITGLSPVVIAELIAGIAPLWHERHQARLTARQRQRAVGTGAKYEFVFVDRLLATLVSLRHGTTHDVLACWFGVDRSTITRSIGEVRPLLAQRGCAIAPDVRLRTLAEVIEYWARWSDRHHRRHGDPRATPGCRPQGPRQVRLRKDQAERREVHGPDGRRGAHAVL